MEAVRSYILSVTAAAMLCAVVSVLHGTTGTHSKILKLMSSVFLVFVLVSPLIKKSFRFPEIYVQNVTAEADLIANNARNDVKQQMQTIIEERTEAYILDKAADLNVNLSVSVYVTEDEEYPTPETVHMTGSVSPYAKKLLSQMLKDDLGIEPEDQIWN